MILRGTDAGPGVRAVEIRHWHMFCGIGGGARGFNRGRARVGNLHARFRCIGGVDADPAACADFERLAGAPATRLDLFSAEQYTAFHGAPPPAGWREATPLDLRRSAGGERPHIVFLSAPCKGFSGLLGDALSRSPKYQALNGLTLRGVWLMLEAWAGDPPELVLFENVPRIATRGRHLLDQIVGLLSAYGYAVAETVHDCGALGGLAQSRKRFLLVARHRAKVPPFLYEPPRRPLRGVGEVLGRLPLPGDLAAGGPMHRVPALHWRTWVRLAFVEAGSDWRSLNKLRVEGGVLADYGIVPDGDMHWGTLGVHRWDQPTGVVAGRSGPTNGAHSVADPRPENFEDFGRFGVGAWHAPAGTVTSQRSPGQGRFAVADPRIDGHEKSVQHGVLRWDEPAGVVTGKMFVGGGAHSVADPRPGYGVGSHTNKFSVVAWGDTARTVTSANHLQGGALSVADPRPAGELRGGKYRVTTFGEPAGTVIAESGTGNGGFAVADPRYRPDGKASYTSVGNYGVVPWDGTSAAVTAAGQHDNGRWSVADPRGGEADAATRPTALPAPGDRLVAVIRALDGTWHRPFTTLELAALQSLFDPDDLAERAFVLSGLSDARWREGIGNGVPSDAAEAAAGEFGRTLLMAWSGQTFELRDAPIWVRPIALALSVDTPETLP